MKVLLVYPTYPNTFWSFKYALNLINKKASHPPLGLLTIASLLPKDWQLRVLDLNTRSLREEDLKWADYVFVSAMYVQRESATEIIKKAKSLGKRVVAGGPLFTSFYEDFIEEVDHLVLNEGEITLPQFLKDLENNTAKKIYRAEGQYADLTKSPIPSYHLIKLSHYTSMCIQYSRGCPFNCEFCDVTNLFGHAIRTKTVDQIIAELENLYKLGWRGSIFFVDDNFIGSKKKVKEELLPVLIKWQEKYKYPFYFYTQVSINLSDDDELIDLMVKAGFTSVFIGIETPNEESLAEVNKVQNLKRNLVENIRKIQKKGLEVMGGFILGFDSDPPEIFDKLVNFIRETRIVISMVGLLNAPPGTKLYKKLKAEGRVKPFLTGDNTDLNTNIIPKMGYENLINGYKKVIKELYYSKAYYQRLLDFIENFEKRNKFRLDLNYFKVHFGYLFGLPKIFLKFGVFEKERNYFFKVLFKCLFKKPELFSIVLAQIVSGYHFRQIFRSVFESPAN
ncbi:MAG: B12-binding domain-containing radical SAM protein [Caldimicrobium sp.]